MQRLPGLYISDSPLGGRGVFTSEFIERDSLVEVCPVLVFDEFQSLESTKLYDYLFRWGDTQNQRALALGFGSLYNHSSDPNLRIQLNYDRRTISFYALKDIPIGTELLFNYRGDAGDQTKVWFE